MKDRLIVTSAAIATELEKAERKTIVARLLLEDTVDPMFQGFTCEGVIEAYSKQTSGDKDAAARLWMEENYDSLYAACYASNVLIGEAADTLDTLQRLPIPTEKEART